jgi:hypothetical protein
VAVGTAQLVKGGFQQPKMPGGEICVDNSGPFASGGCSGTIYLTLTRLSTGDRQSELLAGLLGRRQKR